VEAVLSGACDRRASPRQNVPAGHRAAGVRVRPGRAAALIDVSPIGALIETTYWLPPGSVIDMQILSTDRNGSTRAHVVRCFVSALHGGCVWYRAGVRFERPLTGLGSGVRHGYSLPATESRRIEGERGHGSPLAG
jgi:hypothetical protein